MRLFTIYFISVIYTIFYRKVEKAIENFTEMIEFHFSFIHSIIITLRIILYSRINSLSIDV